MSTISALLLARADDDHLAIIEEDNTHLSWRTFVSGALRRSVILDRLLCGQRSANVGVLLPNGSEYLSWIAACALGGHAVVGINPTRRGAALVDDVVGTNCALIISDAAGLSGFDDSIRESVSCVDVNDLLSSAIGEVTEDEAQEAIARARTVEAHELLLLLFTSGTTGRPKAVRCSQGRLATIGETASAGYGFGRDDICYSPMPLFHGNALMAQWAPALFVGATVAPRGRFSASGFIEDLVRTGATRFTYVGKAIAYILATEPSPLDRAHRCTVGFGTEASAADRAAFVDRFGIRLVEGYGSSEGGIAIVRTPESPPGALGLPPALFDVAIVDPQGNECARARFDEHGRLTNPDDAIGEIVNRTGRGAFEGYYNNENADLDRLRQGWYWSGDLGYRDQDGFFYFAGRAGDWLRVDSENLTAGPIEEVLARFAPFGGVCVYGVPDEHSGEQVMAAVELRSGAVFDPDAFAAWLLDQRDLGTKWAPRYVRIVEALPTTATGKVTKVALKTDRFSGADPLWARGERAGSRYVLVTSEQRAQLIAWSSAGRAPS